jgi:hypothetical protein
VDYLRLYKVQLESVPHVIGHGVLYAGIGENDGHHGTAICPILTIDQAAGAASPKGEHCMDQTTNQVGAPDQRLLGIKPDNAISRDPVQIKKFYT